MGGWHRIFVVFVVLTGGLYAAAWFLSIPDKAYANKVYSCHLEDAYVTPMIAGVILADGYVDDWLTYTGKREPLEESCRDQLRLVRDGLAHSHNVSKWRREAISSSRWMLALWVTVYSIGWSLGWIWRGFRRRP